MKKVLLLLTITGLCFAGPSFKDRMTNPIIDSSEVNPSNADEVLSTEIQPGDEVLSDDLNAKFIAVGLKVAALNAPAGYSFINSHFEVRLTNNVNVTTIMTVDPALTSVDFENNISDTKRYLKDGKCVLLDQTLLYGSGQTPFNYICSVYWDTGSSWCRGQFNSTSTYTGSFSTTFKMDAGGTDPTETQCEDIAKDVYRTSNINTTILSGDKFYDIAP